MSSHTFDSNLPERMMKEVFVDTLNPPDTAPQQGAILGEFLGTPLLFPAVWNHASQKWGIAKLEFDLCNDVQDTYFRTDYISHDKLLGWMPMPTPM